MSSVIVLYLILHAKPFRYCRQYTAGLQLQNFLASVWKSLRCWFTNDLTQGLYIFTLFISFSIWTITTSYTYSSMSIYALQIKAFTYKYAECIQDYSSFSVQLTTYIVWTFERSPFAALMLWFPFHVLQLQLPPPPPPHFQSSSAGPVTIWS